MAVCVLMFGIDDNGRVEGCTLSEKDLEHYGSSQPSTLYFTDVTDASDCI